MSVGSVFKAISDPTRREILKLLNEKDLSAGEIAEHFDISKPALTKHLNILREAELVSSEKQGNFVIYEYSCAMKSHFRKFGNQMSGSGNHLCNYASLLA